MQQNGAESDGEDCASTAPAPATSMDPAQRDTGTYMDPVERVTTACHRLYDLSYTSRKRQQVAARQMYESQQKEWRNAVPGPRPLSAKIYGTTRINRPASPGVRT